MKVDLNIETNGLLREFKEQSNDLNDIMKSEVHNTLRNIRDDAKKLSPVRSGTLRDGVTLELTENGGQVVNLTPYAPYVELGTIYMQAQPFMKPAYRKNIDDLFKNIEKRYK